MIWGFTGTAVGIPPEQLIAASRLLKPEDDFHFGDCIGDDTQVWCVAVVLGCYTVAHPPINSRARAFCNANRILEPKPYLVRNHDIVDVCEKLIATPKTLQEELRSGTWATIRYARKVGKPIIIVGPDGRVYKE